MAIKEYDEAKGKLSTYVPYICLVDEGIVLNQNGTLQTTIKYRGFDLDSCTAGELESINARLNDIIKRFGGEWSLFIEARRIKSNAYEEINSKYIVVNILEKIRKDNFYRNEHFESEYYLTFVKLLPTDKEEKIKQIFIEKENNFITADEHIKLFKKEVKQILNLMDRNIFLDMKQLNDEETYTYLHSCVSTKRHKIHVPAVPYAINYFITDVPLLGGLEPKLGNKHLRIITLKDFPQYTIPGFFDRLNRLNIEYRWVTRFIQMSKNQAMSELEKIRKKYFSARLSLFQRISEQLTQQPIEERRMDESALENASEVKEQMNLTSGDYVSQGYYNCNIILMGDTVKEVESKVELIQKTIEQMGFTTINETVNCVKAFLGSIPGNITDNRRKPILNSVTLSHLLPISCVWGGKERIKNQFIDVPPLIYTTTKGSTPFRFNLHINDVGHSCIVGPTGAGKSVFLGLMSASFMKYPNAKVFFFDKDASSRILTYCMGGQFNDLGVDDISFQPLREIGIIDENITKEISLRKEKYKEAGKPFTEQDIQQIKELERKRAENEKEWAKGWIEEILLQEGIQKLTGDQKEKIWNTLNEVAGENVNERTLSTFRTLINDRKIQEALSQYVITGSLGKYFDSNTETLSFKNWQVFEMSQIMQNKSAITPLLSYIFRKIENSLNSGNPTLIILDECWLFFDNEIFAEKIRDWLKTLRKKNTSVVFATQELGDIVKSKLFTTILDACKTKVFLPNSNAIEESYASIYQMFGLNSKEINTIANAIPKREYYYKSEYGSRLFELGLDKKTLRIIASSDTDSQNEAKILIKNVNSNEEFVNKWIENSND